MSLSRTSSRRIPAHALLALTVTLLGLLLDAPYAPLGAQTPAADESSTTESAIAEERNELAKEIAATRESLATASDDAREQAEREAALLERLDLLYSQQLTGMQQSNELQRTKAETEKALQELRRDGLGAPPFSIADLDRTRAELKTEARRSKTLADNLQAAQETVASAETALEEAERARREAKEALRTNADPAAAGVLQRKLRIRTLRARVAREDADLAELQLANERLTDEIQDLRQTLLTERAALLERAVEFTSEDLGKRLSALDDQQAEITKAIAAASKKREAAERAWANAKRRLDIAVDPAPVLKEEVEARRMEVNTQQLAASLLEQRVQWLDQLREVWRRRHAVAAGAVERPELRQWAQDARDALEELRRDRRMYRTRLREIRDDPTPRVADDDVPESVRRWLRAQAQQLEARRESYEGALEAAAAAANLHDALLKDLDDLLVTVSWRERLSSVAATAASVWNYELLSIDDRPITVAKVLIGLLFFALGLLAAGYVSRQIGDRVLQRMRLQPGSAAALQSAIYYFFVVIVLVFALRLVNVPLTAFTLLGGALAIGLGFGSQNVVNNFISGLILLIEQPVRVHDLIEVDGTHGTVESIGLRSTRVRSSTNVDIIVPNSSFLEKNVINWTLSDDRIRTHVAVGVVYGSPTDKVTEIIRRAVEDHETVLEVPAPIVLFTDFGDNALLFEVHFWLRMRALMQRRIVESDIRYRINEMCNEAGIVIAFPQRDVHLDSVSPVEVKIVDPDRSAEKKKRGDE